MKNLRLLESGAAFFWLEVTSRVVHTSVAKIDMPTNGTGDWAL